MRKCSRHIAQHGHFGEWLQGRLGPSGPVVLVSLPCPLTVLDAWHLAGSGPLRLHGAGQSVGKARRFLRDLECDLTGHVRLHPRVRPGQGMGVSTARLLALARLAGFAGPDRALARACLRAEGASDPLWLPAPARVLWASRLGRCVETLPPVPRCRIVGGLWGGGQRTDAADSRFPDISDLLAAWRAADGLAAFAALASESAARCLALRGPTGDPTARLARQSGALGWVAAHTGGARGLVFAPGTVPPNIGPRLRAAGFRHLVAFHTGAEPVMPTGLVV